MFIMRLRTRPVGHIAIVRQPPGDGWLHEIKHDGFRIMARRDRDRPTTTIAAEAP